MPSSPSASRIASKETDLRRDLLQPLLPFGLTLDHLVVAGGALVARQCRDQPAQDRRGVADQCGGGLLEARRFLRIGIDAHDLEIVVHAPLMEAVEQPRTDAEHRIGFAPQLASERQRHGKRAAAIEHAASTPECQYRRLQGLRERGHFGACILRAAAGDDQDPPGSGKDVGGRGDRVFVDWRFGGWLGRDGCRRRSALAPHVHRAFEHRRPRPA